MQIKKTEYDVPQTLPIIGTIYTYHVAIMPLKPRKATAGGILLPTQAQDMEAMGQQLGVLVATGQDAFIDPSTGEDRYTPKPETGDIVLYNKFAGAGRILIKEQEATNEKGESVLEDVKIIIVSDTSVIMRLEDPTGYKLH